NNAALELQRRFHLLDPEEIETVLRIDLITPIQLSRLLLPGMLDRGYGRIINISSLAGHVGFPFTEAYAAAKDGLIAFSRVRRKAHGCRCRPPRGSAPRSITETVSRGSCHDCLRRWHAMVRVMQSSWQADRERVAEIASELVAIESVNPSLGGRPGGEQRVAE